MPRILLFILIPLFALGATVKDVEIGALDSRRGTAQVTYTVECGENEAPQRLRALVVDTATGKVLVEVSEDFYRPTDVVNLWGDPSKAKRELGWNPSKTSFDELVKRMVDSDMRKVREEVILSHSRVNLAEYLEKGIVK